MSSEELGKTARLDKGFPDNIDDKVYDEFGFEKRNFGKEEVPMFIPFDYLLVSDTSLEKICKSKKSLPDKKNDLITAILAQKTLEHYVFNELNTVLCKD